MYFKVEFAKQNKVKNKMKNKTIVIGNFGENGGNCGQTIKTNVVYNLIRSEHHNKVLAFNTASIKSSPIKICRLVFIILKYKNFVILPAHNALPILAVLFYIFNKKAKYIVIGGWLPEYLDTSKKIIIKSIVKSFELFVETNNMYEKLRERNILSQVLPNFKNFSKLSYENIINLRGCSEKKIKFVYMSRVIKSKGCLDAMRALSELVLLYKEKKIVFDIYGEINESFNDEFYSLLNASVGENLQINYLGFISPVKVQETLIPYHFFLFPTYYDGEGFPGCLVDAFSAGVPVIASDWRYNNEVVNHTKNGFLYKSRSVGELVNILKSLQSITECEYQKLVEACLNDSLAFHEDNVKITMKDYSII